MIKTVTGFKTRPEYITAIQVLPDNIEAVKEFCPVFNFIPSFVHDEYIGYIYDGSCDSDKIRRDDFIVKDKYGYKVVRQEDFYIIYDRAEE